MQSKRKDDMNIEREVAHFTDKYLYPNLLLNITRTDDKQEQLQGYDFIVDVNDKKWYVDEKAAIHFANIHLDSFALEVSSLTNPNGLGWLLDDSKKTTHFVFLWIDKADIPKLPDGFKYDYTKITSSNIKQIHYALVKKSNLLNYLNAIGWDKETINRQAAIIRRRDGLKSNQWVNICNDFKKSSEVKFYYSKHLKEKPIGIMLHRCAFDKIAGNMCGDVIL